MSRAQNEAAKWHPVIVGLRAHQDRVDAIRLRLAGSDFADERGHLSREESVWFERTKAEFPWVAGAFRAHAHRVRLDHPKLFARWISGEIGAARRAKLGYHRWQALRSDHPRWRLDVIAHPPRGDLFELEERTTWRISDANTAEVVLERTFEVCATYGDGRWLPEGEQGPVAVRIESNTAYIRDTTGIVETVSLALLGARNGDP